MPKVSESLVGYCGVICEFCPSFTSGSCQGCDAYADECEFIKCATKREKISCLACEDFPCKLHFEGFDWEVEKLGKVRWRVYDQVFLKAISEI